MLQFYYNPISVNARRVWVVLLEKQIPFEPVAVRLNGDQFSEDFTQLNPMQRVPVLIDSDLKIYESLAILDYLEAKYPTPSLMPSDAAAIATVRMVEMVAVNELQPATMVLTRLMVALDVSQEKLDQAKQRINSVLQLYEDLLMEKPYFVGDSITLADVVAGTLAASLPLVGISLNPFPNLITWIDRLKSRESWQKTAPTAIGITSSIPQIRDILERRL
ncbi:MAG: glutathione S-transferase family protein [Leptolyngbya sp. SIO1D8]|nr:glutathione S-transferase family protein [Leptolyngbya sp. SIO1D8]